MQDLTIPISDYLTLALIAFMLLFALVIIGFVFIRVSRLLDHYRLKYSFDREIERKEISSKDPEKIQQILNTMERLFERRVFKD